MVVLLITNNLHKDILLYLKIQILCGLFLQEFPLLREFSYIITNISDLC